MAKRFYKIDEKVWIKAEKREGKVLELDIPNLTATVSFQRDESELVTRKMKFMDIDKIVKPQDKKPLTINNYNGNVKFQDRKLTILVKYFDPELPKIEKIETGDWIDLRAAEDVELKQGEQKYIRLGVAMSLPFKYEGHMLPRSSTLEKFGIVMGNSQGVIDQSYCGNEDEWKFNALAVRNTTISKGDRIAQFRIVEKMPKVNLVEVAELRAPNRGGFGSTGIK